MDLTALWGKKGFFALFRRTKKCSSEEDKYGNMAMLKKLNDTYRCKCGDFLVYGDDTCTTLVCLSCGFSKPAPPKEVKR